MVPVPPFCFLSPKPIAQAPLTAALIEASEKVQGLHHPAVTGAELATTEAGGWAVRVHLRSDAPPSIREVERAADGQPVIYEREAIPTMVARPAYPTRGE